MRTSKTTTTRRADNALIRKAIKLLEERMAYERPSLSSPYSVREFLRLRLAGYEREAFLAVWLDAQNRLIQIDELFRGTLTQTSVYPREVIKAGLAANAGAVILAHNHPSGICKASPDDVELTNNLKRALALVDIRVVDHFIVGDGRGFSFVEKGLL
jgi:DNA repair protein RadC